MLSTGFPSIKPRKATTHFAPSSAPATRKNFFWHVKKLFFFFFFTSCLFSVFHAKSAEAAPVPASSLSAAELAGSIHLAYVKSTKQENNQLMQNGLEMLTRFVTARTTIHFGKVVNISPETDELAFYPLIYWLIDKDDPLPKEEGFKKLNRFLQHGGTILFDTADSLASSSQDTPTEQTFKLREILQHLNVPPLEPLTAKHVLSRSFFIMPDFPGRYRSGSLWIESSAKNKEEMQKLVQASADGVSPIIITGNGLVQAWADGEDGRWLYRLIPDTQQQRLWAFRGGLNLVMYVLTGNYKADQIQISSFLKRLSR